MAERFDKFTEPARRVLSLAQQEAGRLGHNYFGTEHLLLGLVAEKSGGAARALSASDVHMPKVRSAIEQIIGRGQQESSGAIGLTPPMKQAIELAVAEARRLDHQSRRQRDRPLVGHETPLGVPRRQPEAPAADPHATGLRHADASRPRQG